MVTHPMQSFFILTVRFMLSRDTFRRGWGGNKFNVLGFTKLQAKAAASKNGGAAAGSSTATAGAGNNDDGGGKNAQDGKDELGGGDDSEQDDGDEQDPFSGSFVQSVPVPVRGPLERSTVVQLACGAHHCLALTVAHKVFAWGANGDGQLGIGRRTPSSAGAGGVASEGAPRQVKLHAVDEPAYSVAAGDRHSLAVVMVRRANRTLERTVFAWGCRDNGRLGGVNDAHEGLV